MLDLEDFRKIAHEMVEWICDYHSRIEQLPVRSQAKPGSIFDQLPDSAPESGETIDRIVADFDRILLPGMTHWQSPKFFAYFPANASYPSLLAEFLTAGMAAQCMNWDTSPAAAELEERMMNWIRDAIRLPGDWHGVIHDGASMATLTAMLTAREKAVNWEINEKGFQRQPAFRLYCSTEAHSSIEKGARIAGFGRKNLVKIPVDEQLAMNPDLLEKQILSDLSAGLNPLMVVIALGTTGTTAIDPLKRVAEICNKHGLWLHVDAAYAGTALLLPEYQWMIDGIELADSFVFNPHKWMFTHFDCTAYYVRDREALIRTFEILPEYLKTGPATEVNNYRDWGIPMGRRFRALKLWFVIRNYGLEGIRTRLREHIALAANLEQEISRHPSFEIMAPRNLNVVCFRFRPPQMTHSGEIDRLNIELERRVNESGAIFFTHTRVSEAYTLRMVIAQTYVNERHVSEAWQMIQQCAEKMLLEHR